MHSIVWFRDQDLRISDHEPLRRAAEAAADGGSLLPIFVLEPERAAAATTRRRRHRTQVLFDALADLDDGLRWLGSRLVVVEGEPAAVLAQAATAGGATRVFAEQTFDPPLQERDSAVAEALAAIGVTLELTEGATLAPPGSIRSGAGTPFRVFTAFARSFHGNVRPARPLPPLEALPGIPDSGLTESPLPTLEAFGLELNPFALQGGELAARRRLSDFIEERLEDYAESRDRIDVDGTSRLSMDLAMGTISIRTVWTAIQDALGKHPVGARKFLDELLWREFARHLLAAEPELLERPFQRGFAGLPVIEDELAWEAWAEGRTGYPVVDAAARQLLGTGFVHNRARMITASFLAKDLRLDFRRGERFYMERLVDADLANNDLGWQWSAGCGADAQPWFRVFNPVAQGKRFDPDGSYVRRWLPELERLPSRWIHEPWKAPVSELRELDYPPRIVDHAVARAAWLETVRTHLGTARTWENAGNEDDQA